MRNPFKKKNSEDEWQDAVASHVRLNFENRLRRDKEWEKLHIKADEQRQQRQQRQQRRRGATMRRRSDQLRRESREATRPTGWRNIRENKWREAGAAAAGAEQLAQSRDDAQRELEEAIDDGDSAENIQELEEKLKEAELKFTRAQGQKIPPYLNHTLSTIDEHPPPPAPGLLLKAALQRQAEEYEEEEERGDREWKRRVDQQRKVRDEQTSAAMAMAVAQEERERNKASH